MTHSSDYTITTLSSSITQYTTSNSQPAPFRFGGPHGPLNLRSTCLPYVPTQNPNSSFVFSQVNCPGITPADGGGIPESITARDNLVHWYKMNEGSTSAVTDVGLSASSTDMTLLGASSSVGGPTAIGTPDVIKFNGTTGVGVVNARVAGTNTALGDLFDTNTFTVSWWMKDTTVSYSLYMTWLACVASTVWTKGWGIYYYYANFWPWQDAYNVGAYAGGYSGAGSWRHHVIRYDPAASVSGQWEHFINGTPSAGNASVTLDTGVGTATGSDDGTNVWFSLGAAKRSDGVVVNHTAPYISDLRFYNIAITDANIDSIYAGDWT